VISITRSGHDRFLSCWHSRWKDGRCPCHRWLSDQHPLMAPGRIDNIVFELTQACNQCCRFCYNYWRDGSTPLPPPDPAQARKTLRKLLSQASIGTISFSGGEPMLLRDIHDLALLPASRAVMSMSSLTALCSRRMRWKLHQHRHRRHPDSHSQ
jgi:Predicted Fe-S oxidoreductases